MNYQEALTYINDKDKYGSRLGLDSVGRLLYHLGEPHKDMKYIHIGGTNGKGSISAYIAKCLETAGYRTGLYTSPYLERFTERIQINGVDIPEETLGRLTEEVKSAADRMVSEGMEHPTTFEIVTALGFLYFKEAGVDYIVLEVGLGGRFDSTNIIEKSLASVIATIDYDHMDVLGTTLAEIAYQKAGIIKKDGLVVAYPQRDESRQVIKRVSEEIGSDYVEVDPDDIEVKTENDKGSVFDLHYKGHSHKGIRISMLGDYQIYNASTAAVCLLELRERGLVKFTDEQLYEGLMGTKWKGRLEVLSREPIFLIDGAHNLQGIENLAKAVSLFKFKRLILGVGVLKDKDYTHMIEKLIPLASEVVVTEVSMPRKLKADLLAEEIRKYTDKVYVEPSIDKAVRKAIELAGPEDMVLFGGSLYLIGEVRTIAKTLLI
ncbi:folylpolyglutamate synthase/dihydrofolate synthase family protein [Gudongella oleilytica]|jgi:dihydrofolate synthase/folylpolyglutamate synthase|uniref:bifunctional folylpolyglutamate synthase/dihydrofolate synthase n=1 Tax=Gudongella oleilytica TaxID=1582259 RepID=UPI002A35C3A4|nr:folylpolyglutamate synthase/dihydrofolate synthase family protein [Gudongella oleilytica]MDY0257528.1 folylpolyglutamate synthase/dihydrofolate synthase family protein [Gudongella oleilytica]HMM69242.1 folylpolyglutamate synthase/dihydrofolate synthase family protein [Gudongella oleilytica]